MTVPRGELLGVGIAAPEAGPRVVRVGELCLTFVQFSRTRGRASLAWAYMDLPSRCHTEVEKRGQNVDRHFSPVLMPLHQLFIPIIRQVLEIQ